jgi:hypothetical protein
MFRVMLARRRPLFRMRGIGDAAGDGPLIDIPGLPAMPFPVTPGDLPILPGSPDAPPTLPGTAPSSTLTPGPVPFRPGNWDQTANPPEYYVAQGDTPAGVAALYMPGGAYPGARWTEIRDINVEPDWTLGPNGHYLNHVDSAWDPSEIGHVPGHAWQQGVALQMPQEALDKANELLAQGYPQAPPTPGAPSTKPGAHKPPPLGQTPPSTTSSGTKALVGLLAAMGGALLYKVFT